MTTDDRAARSRALREEMLDEIAARAERGFRDTRWDALRPLPRRRALVVAIYLAIALYGAGLGFDALGLLTLPGIVLALGGMVLLRFATRSVMDLPDELVDERHRAIRGERYRWAYVGVVSMISATVSLLALVRVFPGLGAAIDGDAFDGALVLFLCAMALPGAIHAWVEAEV